MFCVNLVLKLGGTFFISSSLNLQHSFGNACISLDLHYIFWQCLNIIEGKDGTRDPLEDGKWKALGCLLWIPAKVKHAEAASRFWLVKSVMKCTDWTFYMTDPLVPVCWNYKILVV